MTLNDALQQGQFQQALELLDALLQESAEPGKLFLAFELKCFLQDFDGAFADLQRLAGVAPDQGILEEFGPVVANTRRWCARQTDAQFDHQRASLGGLPDYSMLFDAALRLHAAGDYPQAKDRLQQAKLQTPNVGGELLFANGKSLSFSDLQDVDDLTGPHLVCSHPRILLDIPFSQISQLEFSQARGYQDSLWKPCFIKTWSGDQGYVRVYSYYVGTGVHQSEYIRMLRATECEHDSGYSVAFGQRDWQVTSESEDSVSLVGIHRVQKITFRSPA